MRTTLLVVAIALMPARVSAETWREALQAGDYPKAAAILHPLVLDRPDTQVLPDADAAEQLGMLYASGHGVNTDAVMACALLDIAHAAALSKQDASGAERIGQRRSAQCGVLSEPARREALDLRSCFTAWFPERTFPIAREHDVEVSRRGFRVRFQEVELSEPLTLFACAAEVPLVRYVRVESRSRSLPARHFVELYTWSRLSLDGRPGRGLIWHVREIVAASARPVAMEILVEAPAATWPSPPIPPALARVEMKMDAHGNVTWRFPSRDGLAGIFQRERVIRTASR